MTDEKKVQDDHIGTGEIPDATKESLSQENINMTTAEDIGANVEQSRNDTSKTPKESQRPKSKKKAEIASFEEFLANAYKSKGRKVSLTGKVQKQIDKDTTLSDEAKQRLYELVIKDTMLVVPRQLLLAAKAVDKYPRLRTAIFAFVRDILLEHPLFLNPDIERAVRNHEDALSPIEVLKLLSNSYKSVIKDATAMQMKDAEFDKLRCNAVNCMAVWLSEKKGLSIPMITDALYMALWEHKAQLFKEDNARLRALTEIGDFASVGLACGQYRHQAMEESRVADSATREANVLRDKVMELEDEIQSSQEATLRVEEERKIEKESFINEIANLRTQAETEGVHLRDDLEQLRTRVLRRLKSDAALLEDGLQALRRSEPKIHIMVDVAERVTDALRKEIKNLEGGE